MQPVLTDVAARKIIKEKPGFEAKLSAIMAALGM
jgi:hypothetical protein